MANLSLGSASLVTPADFDNFLELRRAYAAKGQEHLDRFNAAYHNCTTADELFERLPVQLDAVLTDTANLVAGDLAANHVFDVSLQTIRRDLEERSEGVADDFNRVQTAYLALLGKAAEAKELQEASRDGRGRVVGGGFGVEGAAQGIAIAAVANAAIGITHGLANLIERAADSRGDREKKRRLLSDPATKADLGNFLMEIALQGCELVVSITDERADKPIYKSVSAEERLRSEAIIENVAAERVPPAEIARVLVQALVLDPFNENAWMSWLEHYGDENGSVEASANVIGFSSVAKYKNLLLQQRKETLIWDTPESCRTSSSELEQYARGLGLQFESERTTLELHAVRLDQERRTFAGVEYTTVDEVAAARQAHEERAAEIRQEQEDQARRTVAGVIHETHDDAESARTRIRQQAFEASRSTGLGWILLPYRRIGKLEGRSCAKEAKIFLGFTALMIFVDIASILSLPHFGNILAGKIILNVAAVLITFLFLPAAVLAGLFLQARRFHDQNRSGWFVLLNLVPYVGWLIAIVFMFYEGTPGPNRFGDDPTGR